MKAAPQVDMTALLNYIDQLAFRVIKPESNVPHSIATTAIVHAGRHLGCDLEALNTVLPEVSEERRQALFELAKIPKASTVANGAVINRAVALMHPDHAFVNVGVWHGFTFLVGALHNPDKRCIGVDKFCVRHKVDGRGQAAFGPVRRLLHSQLDDWTRRAFLQRFEERRSHRHEFFEMDYADYFQHVHQGPIGVYIYDAQHRYRDQLRGLRLAEPFFGKDCIVIIDDTNAEDNRRATLDFIEQSDNEYRMLFDQRTSSNRHPTWWNGLMVFQLTS